MRVARRSTEARSSPSANAITEIPVNLPVRQDLAPDPSNLDPNGFFGGWFPAWKVGDQRAGPYGSSGAVILQRRLEPLLGELSEREETGADGEEKKKKKKSPCPKKKKKKRR